MLDGCLSEHNYMLSAKNKMGGSPTEEHTADPGNKRMEQTSRKQRRMEASSEGGQNPEGAVVP